MIRRIQARNYRCLRNVDVALNPFQVLIGANATGKSALLDAIAFLGDLSRDGLDPAVVRRAGSFRDLVWGRPELDPSLELSIEVDIPDEHRKRFGYSDDLQRYGYGISIKADSGGRPVVRSERATLVSGRKLPARGQIDQSVSPSGSLDNDVSTVTGSGIDLPKARTVSTESNDADPMRNSQSSDIPAADGSALAAPQAGPLTCDLADLDGSRDSNSVMNCVKMVLRDKVRPLSLGTSQSWRVDIQRQGREEQLPDGSSLPSAIKKLRENRASTYRDWLGHVQVMLPGLKEVDLVEGSDQQMSVMLRYETGSELPLSMASEGVRRFLALSLLVYVDRQGEVFLLENPESHIHPLKILLVYQSLNSIYHSQILMTTNSSEFVRHCQPQDILFFRKNRNGFAEIVSGIEHPALKDDHGSDAASRMGVLLYTDMFG